MKEKWKVENTVHQTSVQTHTVTIIKSESDMKQNKEHYDVQTTVQNTEEKERIIVGNEKLGTSKNGNELLLQTTIDQLRINLNRAQQEKEKLSAKEYLLRESFNKTYVILSKELHVPQQNLNEGNLQSNLHAWKMKYMQTRSGGRDGKVYDERSVMGTKIFSTTTTTKVSSVNEMKEIEYEYESKNNDQQAEDEKKVFSFSLFSKKYSFGIFGSDKTDKKSVEIEENDDIFANVRNQRNEEDSLSILMLIAKDF